MLKIKSTQQNLKESKGIIMTDFELIMLGIFIGSIFTMLFIAIGVCLKGNDN